MSVLVSKRRNSSILYLDTARKIADIIPDRMCNLLNKINNKYSNIKYISNRVFGYYYEMPIKLSTDIYLNLGYANRLYTKDKTSLSKRIAILKESIEQYNKLQTLLSIIFSKFKDYINYNAIKNIVDLIDSEIKYIQGVIKHDKLLIGSSEISTT